MRSTWSAGWCLLATLLELRRIAAVRIIDGVRAALPHDDDDDDSVPPSVAALEHELRDAPAVQSAEHERRLLQAFSTVLAAHTESMPRSSADAIITISLHVVKGPRYSVSAKLVALSVMSFAATAGDVSTALLPEILAVCDELASRQEFLASYELLNTLGAVVQSPHADEEMLQVGVHIAGRLFGRGSAIWRRDFENVAGCFCGAAAIVLHSAQRIAVEDHVVGQVVRSAREVLLQIGEADVSLLVLGMTADLVSTGSSEEVLLEAVALADLALRTVRRGSASDIVAELLATAAAQLQVSDLGLVVEVCATANAAEIQLANVLGLVVQRLTFAGPMPASLHLLALSVALQAQHGGTPKCEVVLRRLVDLPSLSAELAFAMEPWLSEEIAAYVDDFIPQNPQEAAMGVIVEVCAEVAPRSMLVAACLRPARIGLRAALAFRAGVARGGATVLPSDFVGVSQCLTLAAEQFRVEHIASELLTAAADLYDAWTPSWRLTALTTLCSLAGGSHELCKRLGQQRWSAVFS
mmetsp:Transcript_123426/g.356822  ORF Transcript_123426/g.356822 Transcript_123426/m.356822 type:complete len:525 (+) Transcript_123426:53-1627(+)